MKKTNYMLTMLLIAMLHLMGIERGYAATIKWDGSDLPVTLKAGASQIFTYTATDPAGNVSREATVTVDILKPTDARQYTDTVGQECRFAAEWRTL